MFSQFLWNLTFIFSAYLVNTICFCPSTDRQNVSFVQNLQERVASLQNMFETLSSTESELRQKGVSISPSLQNRIDQLYRRWKQLQIQLLQRQHALQEAYSSLDLSSMPGLLGQ